MKFALYGLDCFSMQCFKKVSIIQCLLIFLYYFNNLYFLAFEPSSERVQDWNETGGA